MRYTLWICVVSLCTARLATPVEPQAAGINMVRWLSGSWKGEAFGGTAEEIWSEPAGGSMIGMFQLIDKDKVAFCEFEEIAVQDNLLVFRVKHFTPAFVGWEEKDKSVDFKFLSSTENEVRFDGLTLTRIDENTCKHTIKLLDKATGKTKDVEILYHRTR